MADIYPRNLILNHVGSRAILFPPSDLTDNKYNLFLFYPVKDSRDPIRSNNTVYKYGPGFAYLCIRYNDVDLNSFEESQKTTSLTSKTGLNLNSENSEIDYILCDDADTRVSFYYVSQDMTQKYSTEESFLYSVAQAIVLYQIEEFTVKYVDGKPHLYSLLQPQFRQMLTNEKGRVRIRKQSDFSGLLKELENIDTAEYSASDPAPNFAKSTRDFVKLEAARFISKLEGTVNVTYPGFHTAILPNTPMIFSKDNDLYMGISGEPTITYTANGIYTTSFLIHSIKSIKNMLRLSNRDCGVFQFTTDIPPFVSRATQVFSGGFDWRRYAYIDLAGFTARYLDELSLETNIIVNSWALGDSTPPSLTLLEWVILVDSAETASSLTDAQVTAIETKFNSTTGVTAALQFLWGRITTESIRKLEPYIYFAQDSGLTISDSGVAAWQNNIQPLNYFSDVSDADLDYILPRNFFQNIADPDTYIRFRELAQTFSLSTLYSGLANKYLDPTDVQVFKADDPDVATYSVSPFKYSTTEAAPILASKLKDFILGVRQLTPYRYDWWRDYGYGAGYTPIVKIKNVDLRND